MSKLTSVSFPNHVICNDVSKTGRGKREKDDTIKKILLWPERNAFKKCLDFVVVVVVVVAAVVVVAVDTKKLVWMLILASM